MQFPKWIYGKYANVKARSRRYARDVLSGMPLSEAAGDLVEVDSLPGMIVLDGPSTLVRGDNFHAYMVLRAISNERTSSTRPEWEGICSQMWGVDWGLLALASPGDGTNLLNSDGVEKKANVRPSLADALGPFFGPRREIQYGSFVRGVVRESRVAVHSVVPGCVWHAGFRRPSFNNTFSCVRMRAGLRIFAAGFAAAVARLSLARWSDLFGRRLDRRGGHSPPGSWKVDRRRGSFRNGRGTLRPIEDERAFRRAAAPPHFPCALRAPALAPEPLRKYSPGVVPERAAKHRDERARRAVADRQRHAGDVLAGREQANSV